ncbi:hypothetical protein [Arthrobacter castelli]|uniref:hypothetical protein n=1 Tax=Arthrobacter castelli TaxID=271431 RepID=UPI0003F73D75|nr:hypothetical protein [Arthrobacter castelli]
MTTSTTTRTRNITAISGLLCAVVFIGGLFVTGLLIPSSAPANLPRSDPAEIQQFFVEQGDLAQVQALIQTASAALLLIFSGSLASLSRRSGKDTRGMADIALAGGVLASVFLIISALIAATLGVEQVNDSPAAVSLLRQLSFFVGGTGHTIGLGILVGASSLAARGADLLPRWLTTAGMVSAVLSLLSVLSLILPPTAVFIPLGRFSALLVIAAASVLMVRGRTVTSKRSRAGISVLSGVGVVLLAVVVMVAV